MKEKNETFTESGRRVKRFATGELSPEEIKEADEILAADELEHEVRVNFRWGNTQVDFVKSVAEQIGIPYQTYMKQAIYKQCTQDAASFLIAKSATAPAYVPLVPTTEPASPPSNLDIGPESVAWLTGMWTLGQIGMGTMPLQILPRAESSSLLVACQVPSSGGNVVPLFRTDQEAIVL